MKTLLMLITALLPSAMVVAGTGATNNATTPEPRALITNHDNSWQDARLVALAELESGNRDGTTGRAGEVSRYQILPSVWRQYTGLPLDAAINPFTAANVVQRIMADRIKHFGKQPSDEEWYLLFHCPSHVVHPNRMELKTAIRFENLCHEQD